MKTIFLFQLTAFCMTLATGCGRTEEAEQPVETTSRLIAKAAPNQEVSTMAGDGEDTGQIVFTGDDILWFNEATGELRFHNNYSGKTVLEAIHTNAIRFYINDEYLFSSMLCVSSLHSQTFNSPVFYYNLIENKFYLTDGYPDASVLPDPQKAQAERDENMRQIANEWSRFIDRLNQEEKLLSP
jgi:hypothetical protein